MNLTAKNYEGAVSQVVKNLRPLAVNLVSAYLYGSTARGETRLGKSDVDIGVFLRSEVWANREAFFKTLDVLEEVGQGLVQSGIPFDGICHYGEDETRYMPLPWQCEFLSDKDTRLLAGKNIAAYLEKPVPFSNGLHVMFYLVVFPGAAWLAKEELTAQDRSHVAGLLQFIRKAIPQIACAAAGHPSVKRGAPGVLSRLFPDVDLSILGELEDLREGDGLPESVDVKALLKKALVLTEELQRRITERAEYPR